LIDVLMRRHNYSRLNAGLTQKRKHVFGTTNGINLLPTRVLVLGMAPLGTQREIQRRLFLGGDREQDTIKITAAFLNTMHRTWAEALEREREEMTGELAALLATDPVLKEVDAGA
jgi:hypothetical protein